jgi:hypothetical protein
MRERNGPTVITDAARELLSAHYKEAHQMEMDEVEMQGTDAV